MATHSTQSSDLGKIIKKVLQHDLGEQSTNILLRHLQEYGIDLRFPEDVSFDELEEVLCGLLGSAGRLVMDHICNELRLT